MKGGVPKAQSIWLLSRGEFILEDKKMDYEPPQFLVVKTDVMERVLAFSGKTVKAFANDLGIKTEQAYSLLSGEKVGVDIARKFINHYKAEYAHRYIDWAALGIPDPYRKMRKRSIVSRHFDRRGRAAVGNAPANQYNG